MILFAPAMSKPDIFPALNSDPLTVWTNSPKQSFRRDGVGYLGNLSDC
jgi:hypothetical protein